MPEFRRLRSVWLLLAVGVLAVVAVLAIAIPPLVSGLARQPTGLVYAYDGVSHGEPAPSGKFGTLPSTDPMGSVSATAGDWVSSALFVTVVGAETAANAGARSAMGDMLAQGIHCGTDCSEIADSRYNAAGKQGEILRVEPAKPGLNLTVTEDGQQVKYLYHKVYSDGNYGFDPRLSPEPIPIQEWQQSILGDNPGATIQRSSP